MEHKTLKAIISVVAFLAAVVIGFIALFIPPTGIIDASVLWFIAQLLVFVSSLLGINLSIDNIKQVAEVVKKKKDNNDNE